MPHSLPIPLESLNARGFCRRVSIGFVMAGRRSEFDGEALLDDQSSEKGLVHSYVKNN
jgi:hypothetical protein